jgi:hypothetical protein
MTFALTKPQLEHAWWGSLAFPHLGQTTSAAGVRAWWARRVRFLHLDILPTGNILELFRLYSPTSASAA